MKINVNGELLEFANSKANIETILETINNKLEYAKLELSHLIIDGESVYEDFYVYFETHIDSIEDVVVEVQDLKQVISETLRSAFDYMSNVVIVLRPLSEEFYQSPVAETWTQLANLFEGIQWIIKTQEQIDSINNLEGIVTDYAVWNDYVQNIRYFKEQIMEMEQAMTNQDNILIGDLLLYEVLPIFETAHEKLRLLVPPAEAKHVS